MAEDLNRSVRIHLNTSDAVKKYNELVASTERLKKEIALLSEEGKETVATFQKSKTQIDVNVTAQQRLQQTTQQTNSTLAATNGITTAKSHYNSFQEVIDSCKARLQSLQAMGREGDPAFAKLQAELDQATAAQREFDAAVQRTESYLSSANGAEELSIRFSNLTTETDQLKHKLNVVKEAGQETSPAFQKIQQEIEVNTIAQERFQQSLRETNNELSSSNGVATAKSHYGSFQEVIDSCKARLQSLQAMGREGDPAFAKLQAELDQATAAQREFDAAVQSTESYLSNANGAEELSIRFNNLTTETDQLKHKLNVLKEAGQETSPAFQKIQREIEVNTIAQERFQQSLQKTNSELNKSHHASGQVEKKSQTLTAATQQTTQELSRKGSALKQNTQELTRLEKQLAANTLAQEKFELRIKETQRVMNHLSGATLKELDALYKRLRTELSATTRGTADYTAKLQQLRAVESERKKAMAELNAGFSQQQSLVSRAATAFNKYAAGAMAVMGAITGISMLFRSTAQAAAKMDDAFADVIKTTGLTRDQVVALNEAFKKLDTRTTREQLNNLAYTAGKLGISAEKDVLGFVKAADTLNIAMGDVLGDDASIVIGKMVGVYAQTSDILEKLDLEKRMVSLGSAVNELGKTSTANEAYLVDFAGRLGGVAVQAGLSIDQILGFGSALDQNMQKVEMSATSFQKLLMKMLNAPAEFAAVVKMPVEEFTKLMNEDMNGAIKAVLKSFSGAGGFQQLAPIFKDLGVDGARAAAVIASMASSMEKIETAQEIANTALIEGTSVMNEYTIKNNNLQAELEKARKRFEDASIALGESLAPALLKSTKLTTHLIKALSELGPWFKENKGLLWTLVVTLTAYTVAVNLNRLALLKQAAQLKALSLWKATLTAGTYALAAAQALLTGNLGRAAAAWRALTASMAVNPFVAVGIALAAIVAGLYKLITYQSDATKRMNAYTAEVIKQQRELSGLIELYKRSADGTKDKATALAELKKRYAPYLQDLLDEKGKITDIEAVHKRLNTLLAQQIALKMQNAQVEQIIEENVQTIADHLNTLRDQVVAQKGEIMGNKLISEINQLFQNSTNTYKTAFDALALLQRNGINILSHKGAWEDVRTNLWDVQRAFNAQAVSINNVKQQFKSYIGEFQELSTPPSESTTADTPTDPISIGAGEDKATSLAQAERKRLEQELKTIEQLWQEFKILSAQEQQEGKKSTQEHQTYLAAVESLMQEERLEHLNTFSLQYKENEEWRKEETLKTQSTLLAAQDAFSKQWLSQNQSTYNEELTKIKENLTAQEDEQKGRLARGEISQELYNKKLTVIEWQSIIDRGNLWNDYHAALIAKFGEGTAAYQAAVKQSAEAEKQIQDDTTAYFIANWEKRNKLFEQYQSLSLGEMKSRELAAARAVLGDKWATDERYLIIKRAIEEKYENERFKALSALGLIHLKEKHRQELEALEAHLKEINATEEEAGKARNRLKGEQMKDWLAEAQKYVEQAGEIAKVGVDITKGLQETETAYLEVEYTKRSSALTEQFNQGLISQEEYNAQKQQLDYEQKVEELEIQKRYADANFAMQVASILISSLMGAMQAFAGAMSLGPIAGPIVGGLLAAGIATMAGVQIAQANAEREKIKAMTIESPASSSSSGAARIPLPQAAKGRYNVIGQEDNKHYNNVPYIGTATTGEITTPTLVAERGSEMIIDHNTLERIRMNHPYIIEAIKANRVPQRAEGNYRAIDDPVSLSNRSRLSNLSNKTLTELSILIQNNIALLQELKANGVQAPIVLSELEKKQALRNRFRNKGSQS